MQAIKKILNIYCWGLPSWIRLERSLVCNVLPKGLILLPQEIKNLKLRLRKKIQSIIWYEVYLINIAVLGPENNGHHWIRIWFFFFVLTENLHGFLHWIEIICERLTPGNPKIIKNIVLEWSKNNLLFYINVFSGVSLCQFSICDFWAEHWTEIFKKVNNWQMILKSIAAIAKCSTSL